MLLCVSTYSNADGFVFAEQSHDALQACPAEKATRRESKERAERVKRTKRTERTKETKRTKRNKKAKRAKRAYRWYKDERYRVQGFRRKRRTIEELGETMQTPIRESGRSLVCFVWLSFTSRSIWFWTMSRGAS